MTIGQNLRELPEGRLEVLCSRGQKKVLWSHSDFDLLNFSTQIQADNLWVEGNIWKDFLKAFIR